MLKLNRLGPVVLAFASLWVIASCSDTKFRGSGSTGSKPDSDSSNPPTVTVDECKDKSEVVGVDLAFVIDNSGSNAHTDCANRVASGRDRTNNIIYQCDKPTNRALAVTEAFNALKGISKGDAASDSQLAITSFPSQNDIYSGSDKRTNGWVSVSQNDQSTISTAVEFTRWPLGMTPYGAGLNAAADLFDGLGDTGRQKLLILVTDGEPTDENPGQVLDQVNDRLNGIKLVTVMVSDAETREGRKAEHSAYLSSQHGYSQGIIDQLVGGNGQLGLAEAISSKIIEIPASAQLEQTFKDIISENVTCK